MIEKDARHWRILLLVVVAALTVLSGIGSPCAAQAQDPDAAYQEALDRIQAAKDTGATTLDLAGLGLIDLPPEIGQLTHLYTLHLSGNDLTSLPPEIGQLTNLVVLDLNGNHLTSLPKEFNRLHPTDLNLSDNGLTRVPPEVYELDPLSLDLSDNGLTSLSSEIGSFTYLCWLNLSGNHLTNLPPEIGQLTRLDMLDLSSNALTSLPPEIGQLAHLTMLNLSGNGLTSLPSEIGQLTSLQELDLSGNGLTSVPPEVYELTQLLTLDLSDNALTSVASEIGQLTHLTMLNLSGNPLTSLPWEIDWLPYQSKLDLGDNTNVPRTKPPPAPAYDGPQQGLFDRLSSDFFTVALAGVMIWTVAHFVLRWSGILFSEYILSLMTRPGFDPDLHRNVRLRLLSWLYRGLIILAMFYFYASLIFTAVLCVGWLVGKLFQVADEGPIALRSTLLIGVISYFSLSAMWRMFRVQVNKKPPGRILPRAEAPLLWGAVDDAANRVGARAVDTVCLVPEPTIGVTLLGSLRERIRADGQLCLVLGVGAIPGLTQIQLKAFLAHEYGHVVGGDVAGGSVALRVKAALSEMGRAFRQHGQGAWFNPVWLFMVYYGEIFLRISRGASQLQETVADRVAAQAYGGKSLCTALIAVIRQTVEFDVQVTKEIALAREEKRELSNLWQLPSIPRGGYERYAMETRIGWAINSSVMPYDTHPPPARRLEWIEKIEPKTPVDAESAPVWDWFPDREALQAEMTALVQRFAFFRDALRSSALIQRSKETLSCAVAPESAWELEQIPRGQQPRRRLRRLLLALMVTFVAVTVPSMEAASRSLQMTFTEVAVLLLAGMLVLSGLIRILDRRHGKLISAVWLWNHNEFEQAIGLLRGITLGRRAQRLLHDMQDQLSARERGPEAPMLKYELAEKA
jgi:Leucine-rich repeat (LRR) protein/Zn-dependent protease with chaperone function